MLKEDKIVKVKKPVRLELSKDKFSLPSEIQAKVDAYWQELVKKRPFFKRGSAFSVFDICEKEDATEFRLALSDYAHYMYTREVGLPEELAFNNMHTACVIETADENLVFGLTGKNTAKAGIWQCVGGGLDQDDVEGCEINLEHNIKKELQEEVGIDADDEKIASELKLKYLKYGHHGNSSFVAAIFYLKLKLSEKEFCARYEEFKKRFQEKGQVPEIQKLLCLPKKKATILEFLQNSKQSSLDIYMEALLEELASEKAGEN